MVIPTLFSVQRKSRFFIEIIFNKKLKRSSEGSLSRSVGPTYRYEETVYADTQIQRRRLGRTRLAVRLSDEGETLRMLDGDPQAAQQFFAVGDIGQVEQVEAGVRDR